MPVGVPIEGQEGEESLFRGPARFEEVQAE
jgi:hypothetical protein